MPKKCDACTQEFKGFGTTCSACRLGNEKQIYKCEKCGAIFNGKTNVCEQCGGRANAVVGANGDTGVAARMSVSARKSLIGRNDNAINEKFANIDPADLTECPKCKQGFGSQPSVIFEGQRFHTTCFQCDRCDKPIKPGEAFRAEDKIICPGCTSQTFCDGCHKRLTGTITKVNGKQYHPDCFKCDECHVKLVGGFAKVGDQQLCRECAQKKSAKGKCVRCDKPITGPAIRADKGDLFHKECFTCYDCNQPLKSFVRDESRKFKFQKAEYLCRPCAEIRAKNPPVDDDISSCAICGSEYPKGTFWCTKCQAPCYTVDESNKVCCICKGEITGPGAYQLKDGSVFHVDCFKCAGCGAPGLTEEDIKSGNMKLANVQMDAAERGEFFCSKCVAAKESGQ